MVSCSYCGRTWKEHMEACASCGAPNKQAKVDRYDPFFYDGYIVYAMRRFELMAYEFVFYKGITLMGTVRVTEEKMRTMSPVEDYMPMVIDILHEQVTA